MTDEKFPRTDTPACQRALARAVAAIRDGTCTCLICGASNPAYAALYLDVNVANRAIGYAVCEDCQSHQPETAQRAEKILEEEIAKERIKIN